MATSLRLQPKGDVEIFTPYGSKYPTLSGPGKEWTEVDIEGWASFNDMTVLWACLVGYQTVTPNGSNAYTWDHATSSTAVDVTKTLTVEQGGVVRAQRASYVVINELELTFDRSKVNIKGSGFGQLFTDVSVAMTASPTEVDPVPILGKHWAVYVDVDSANLGGTRLSRVTSGRFKFGPKFNQLWTVNDQVSSYVAVVEMETPIEGEIHLEADTAGMSYLPLARTNVSRFVRFEALGPGIAGGPQVFQERIDFCAKFSDMPSLEDADGVYQVSYALRGVHDPTWAKALAIQEVNTLISL